MKVAPIIRAIGNHNQRLLVRKRDHGNDSELIQHVLVHTGQHYDAVMSDSFFADLNLPSPDVHLAVGSASHATQTAEIMKRFEPVLLREKPDALVVVGDVNSTVACALVASKISFDASGTRPLIAHVEAGLRSFDRTMPEEINRIVTDQLSDLLFVTEESAMRNLSREGVPAEKVHFVGNTMIDSLLACETKANGSEILDDLVLRSPAGSNGPAGPVAAYAVLTLHRPANVDCRDAFLDILEGLEELAKECIIVFPAHPRTWVRITEFRLENYFEANHNGNGYERSGKVTRSRGIHLIQPVGYLDFVCLVKNARLVVTDSGGIQEETTCLGIPCVTVRENTERPVTLVSGTNVLAGTTKEGIAAAIRQQMNAKPISSTPKNWDGHAAARIVAVLSRVWSERNHLEPLSQAPDA